MGAVYEVIDPQLGRAAALKLLKGSDNDVAVERFFREAEVLARLAHPGVVKVHRVGELPQGPFILEERPEGRPLDALLTERGAGRPSAGRGARRPSGRGEGGATPRAAGRYASADLRRVR